MLSIALGIFGAGILMGSILGFLDRYLLPD